MEVDGMFAWKTMFLYQEGGRVPPLSCCWSMLEEGYLRGPEVKSNEASVRQICKVESVLE